MLVIQISQKKELVSTIVMSAFGQIHVTCLPTGFQKKEFWFIWRPKYGKYIHIETFYSGDYTLSIISKYRNRPVNGKKKNNDDDYTTVTSQAKQVFHCGT